MRVNVFAMRRPFELLALLPRRASAWVLFVASILISSGASFADIQPGPDDVYVRVVDVGPGLCTITKTPGGHYMIYDAGRWDDLRCFTAVSEIIGNGTIDLMIISHSDADHLGNADEILNAYPVNKIIRTGFQRDSGAWRALDIAIAEETREGASVQNLRTDPLVPGTRISLGEATVTLIAGWPEWTGPGPTESERRNAISIVVRLDYRGLSVLFSGDTVGRRLTDPDDACKDAEASMVANSMNARLASNVLIAPHHGGNNGNSRCFIEAVSPQFVVFSAGHDYGHPSGGAAGRYIAAGVRAERMLRTDRGDDEGGFEWTEGRVPGCHDGRGDDDIEVLLPEQGELRVEYRMAAQGC